MGRIVIGGGRMAAMMIDWRHDIPGDQKREYSGYTASYTYDGKQLVTTVDAAPDPGRIGTKQPRGVRFENGLMILTPPPRVVDGSASASAWPLVLSMAEATAPSRGWFRGKILCDG